MKIRTENFSDADFEFDNILGSQNGPKRGRRAKKNVFSILVSIIGGNYEKKCPIIIGHRERPQTVQEGAAGPKKISFSFGIY